MKNCGECKHVETTKVINLEFAHCGISKSAVPQLAESGKPIEFLRVADDCPLQSEGMTARVAIQAMKAGYRITSLGFTDEEFLVWDQSTGMVLTEDGFGFEDIMRESKHPCFNTWRVK